MESASRYDTIEEKAHLITLLEQRDREIERLQLHLLNMTRKLFVSKSERQTSSQQESLFSFSESTQAPEAATEEVPVAPHKREIKRGRKPLAASLPRRREEHYPEQKSCTQCGAELQKIGEEITEELEHVPAHFVVVEHAKIKCACPHCVSEGVKTGVLPPSAQPLPGARPGAGLLTSILVSKFVDHVPLFRQEQIFARQGIIIPRQRMCDWLAGVMCYLEMLWRILKTEALSSNYVHADETYIKVREIETPGRLLQGYFWAVHAPPNLAFFEYFDNRSSESAKELLKGFRGRVQTDAYAGYNAVLFPEQVERIACMAHIRRKFIESRTLAPTECDRIIKQIAKLYALERKWAALTPMERQAQRERVARPELERLFRLMEEVQRTLMPRHKVQEALSYALSQSTEMFRYLEDGRYALDNNAVERQIRPIALGRKNYLFAGSDDGARRAAVFYSLLATCKLNKVNPAAWLTHVLKTMPSLPRARYAELLPHRWTPPSA